jgi:CubicO group peptidase (beta-lactamase class C family)
MSVRDREVLTMALGDSMTVVPSTTDMLLLMLVEQRRITLDDGISRWFPQLLAADQVTVRMLVANTVSYPDYVTMEDFLTAMPG